MPILLLDHRDDLHGPWLRQRWDRIVDLGRMPPSVYEKWSREAGCPVGSIHDHLDTRDQHSLRGLLQAGRGAVVDEDGIDWWDVLFHLHEREWLQVAMLHRYARSVDGCDRLTTTRPSLVADALRLELQVPLQVLRSNRLQKMRQRASHYRSLLRTLGSWQVRQVLHDKYDATYGWRRRFAQRPPHSTEPVVLLPSAYGNVSKTAVAYAKLLPQQKFMLVAAREHAAIRPLPANVRGVELAAYATGINSPELARLTERWDLLERKLAESDAFRAASVLGLTRRGRSLLRWGLVVRDAWKEVFATEPVAACLSADDFNPYTRLPLLLARLKNIPTVACHHGAFDGRVSYKKADSDIYLAKSPMEEDYLLRVCDVDRNRLRVGAPQQTETATVYDPSAPWLVFFSEPFEIGYWRPEAIFGEILPRLCQLARIEKKTVVLKLHPFESAKHRRRILSEVLSSQDLASVEVVDEPMSPAILRRTWCAVVGVSSAALDCVLAGIPTFLCGWLRLTHAGYAEQFARFGVGRTLQSPDELSRVSELIPSAIPPADLAAKLVQPIAPAALASVLVKSCAETPHA